MIPIEPLPQPGRSKMLSETRPILDQVAQDQGYFEEFQDVFEGANEKPVVAGFESFFSQEAIELPKTSPKPVEQVIEILTEIESGALQVDVALEDLAGGRRDIGLLEPESNAVTSVLNGPAQAMLSTGVSGVAELKFGGKQDVVFPIDAPKGRVQEQAMLRPLETAVAKSLPTNEKATNLRGAQIASSPEVNSPSVFPTNSTATAVRTMTLRTAIPTQQFAGQIEHVAHGNLQVSGTVERNQDRAITLAESVPMALLATKPVSYTTSPTVPTSANFGELPMLREGIGSMDLSESKTGLQEIRPFAGQDAGNRPVLNALPQTSALPVVQNASVSQQVAMQISLQVGNARKSEIELRLEPEELGKVRIVLLPRDMGMTLSIVAERPETLELLRRNADQLLTDLGGMDLGNASLEFSGGEREWAAQEDASPFDLPDDQVTSVTVTSAGTTPGRLDIRL